MFWSKFLLINTRFYNTAKCVGAPKVLLPVDFAPLNHIATPLLTVA